VYHCFNSRIPLQDDHFLSSEHKYRFTFLSSASSLTSAQFHVKGVGQRGITMKAKG
jgi:hypothetical protein